jgi:hypothetical protein
MRSVSRAVIARAVAAGLALGVVMAIAMLLLGSDRNGYIEIAIVGVGALIAGAITVFLHPSRRRSRDGDS